MGRVQRRRRSLLNEAHEGGRWERVPDPDGGPEGDVVAVGGELVILDFVVHEGDGHSGTELFFKIGSGRLELQGCGPKMWQLAGTWRYYDDTDAKSCGLTTVYFVFKCGFGYFEVLW